MTERIRAEETLRQAQKIEALGQLTGGVAHDFNNLLMVIIAGLDMLERRTDIEQRRRIVEAMRQAAQRGATLTRQLLTFSRTQQLKPEVVNIARQIGGMGELLQRSLRGDVDVRMEFDEDLWPVEVDPGELELMVINLAVNARDAMPKGGAVTLRAQNVPNLREDGLSGDYVLLSISDTGTGMTPEVRKHLFEPFFTTKEVGQGTGLGLAFVHGAAQHGGGFTSFDTAPGKGTTISVFLPVAKVVAEPVAAPAAAAAVEVGRGATILLVED
jgi:signal transduction histidine kinase